MFDLFKKRTAKEFLADAKDTYELPKLTEPLPMPTPKEDRAYYTVGSLDDGRVQLTVGYPSSISLTMNEAAVRQMIKLLEAAITEKDQFK